jgi:hypothetical protein
MEGVAMKRNITLPLAVALCALLPAIYGCSITGWAVKDPPEYLRLEKGDLITVTQDDGSIARGTFAGLETLSIEEYNGIYAGAGTMRINSTAFPAIGEKIQFLTSLDEMKIWEGRFLGFDEQNLLVMLPGESQPGAVTFTSLITMANSAGEALQRTTLRGMYIDGTLPTRSAITLAANGKALRIPVSKVAWLIAQRDGTTGTATIAYHGNDFRSAMLQ